MPRLLGSSHRLVSLVLCDAQGTLIGQLGAFVARPRFWPEVTQVVEGARAAHGIDVMVLRLLTTSGGYAGGRVTYLAQLCSGTPRLSAPGDEASTTAAASDPAHRQWWAEPDALAGLPGWVDEVLGVRGRRRTGPLLQRKTWNLSLIMTAPTESGDVWLKATPPFLADEGGVIARVAALDADLAPRVLAHDPARRLILMEHVQGADQWGLADHTVIDAMISRWVAVQQASAADIEHLVALGAADLRPRTLVAQVEDAATRPDTRAALTSAEREAVDRLVEGLPARLVSVEECGMPATLVHGDLHPGNWRRDGDRLALLDWGGVAVGNPVVDMRAFVERLDGSDLQERTRTRWVSQWQHVLPGSDPGRAARLMAPVAELAAAATYQRFLDHIERTERVYHLHDPIDRFRAALAADPPA